MSARRRCGRFAPARVKKGDPLQTARLAGIMAAKQTSALIPLCHPLPLSHVDVELTPPTDGYDIEARVRTTAQTGVEMEALTAVAVAALTIYDMVKAVDKTMVIADIRLVEKRGGKSATMDPDVRTIADLPFHVMGRFQSAPVIGSARGGEVHSLTGKEFFDGIREPPLGLTALGMEAGDRVAIISESRPEWLTVDLAILAGGAVTVPIYPTLSAAQVRYILDDSGATHRGRLDAAAAREDPGGPASAAGARRRSS